MSIKHFPFLIAGEATTTDSRIAIRNPFDGRIVATVSEADPVHIESAIAAASAVATEFASTPVHIRADALIHISTRLNDRHEEIAQLISAESGKPIKWARVEVTRAATTFRWAAEEARRWSGHMQRLDTDAGSDGRLALVHRVPRGPILGIAPFNFPLNLVAHKVAPALAVGAPIIVKPAPATPLSSLVLGELLAETSLPEGAWSVLTVSNEKASEMVQDPRLPVVSFTGSVPVGWAIRDRVPRKHVTLELGGNAAVVVCEDWSDEAGQDFAAERIARFSMYQAGQSCIAVQRVLSSCLEYSSFGVRQGIARGGRSGSDGLFGDLIPSRPPRHRQRRIPLLPSGIRQSDLESRPNHAVRTLRRRTRRRRRTAPSRRRLLPLPLGPRHRPRTPLHESAVGNRRTTTTVGQSSRTHGVDPRRSQRRPRYRHP